MQGNVVVAERGMVTILTIEEVDAGRVNHNRENHL
jgi:hypothetical protein